MDMEEGKEAGSFQGDAAKWQCAGVEKQGGEMQHWVPDAPRPGQKESEAHIVRFNSGSCDEPADICSLFAGWTSPYPFSTCQPDTLQPASW